MSGNRKQVEDPGFSHQSLGKGGWEKMNPILKRRKFSGVNLTKEAMISTMELGGCGEGEGGTNDK